MKKYIHKTTLIFISILFVTTVASDPTTGVAGGSASTTAGAAEPTPSLAVASDLTPDEAAEPTPSSTLAPGSTAGGAGGSTPSSPKAPDPTAGGAGGSTPSSPKAPDSTAGGAGGSAPNEAARNDAAGKIKKFIDERVAIKKDAKAEKDKAARNDAAGKIKKFIDERVAIKKDAKAEKDKAARNDAAGKIKKFIDERVAIKKDAKAEKDKAGGSPPPGEGGTKAQNYANHVSLTMPQLIALDTITNRMQGWTNESLLGAGEDNTPAEMIIPWISGHYGTSRQGKTNFIPGYKVNFAGFSVGSDFVINEKVKLGLSYSNITSKLKVKGNQNADGTKSHTISVYGQYNFTNDLFAQSAIAYTVGSSKNRPNNLNSYKVSSNGLGGFIALNKDFLLQTDISVTPRIGLRYIENKEKDTNLGGGNKIKGAKNRYFTGIFGATLSAKKQLENGTSLKPILYAGLEKNFTTKNKAPMAHVEEVGGPFERQNTTKSQKISYVLGTGLSTKHSNLLLSLSYQCSLAKKYVGHQGILKLGLAF